MLLEGGKCINMKFCINQAVFFPSRTEDFLEQCAKWDVNAVELRVPKLKEWLFSTSATEVKNFLKNKDIKVVALNSIDDFGLVPDENLHILEKEAELIGRFCDIVECPLVIAPVGRWFEKRMPNEEVLEKTVIRLDILGDILNNQGITVGVEPIAFPEFSIHSIFDADKVCQASNCDSGLVVDFYNLFQGGMEPKDFHFLETPISIIHINDAEFLFSESLDVVSTREFPGFGSLNAVEWVQEAYKSNYEGVFSLEIFSEKIWKMPIEEGMYYTMKKIHNFQERVAGRSK